MSSSAPQPLLLLSCLLLLSSAATAFNLINILSKHSEFSSFSQALNETGIAKEASKRSSITVLAVNNGAMGSISGKDTDIIKRILSTHIILDYYDVPKIQKMKDKTALLTTLYQSSGVADGRQGFLNVTNEGKGTIVFGSAVKGAPLDSKLLKLVTSQPFNISVLEVSSVIVAPGIDGNFTSPPPAMAPGPGMAPKKAPKKAPPPKKGKASEPSAEEPVADSPADAPASEDAPAPSPAPAEAPKSDTASDAPTKEDAVAPASSASRAILSVGAVMGALLVAF